MISHKVRLTLRFSAVLLIALLGQPATRAVSAEPWVIIQPDAVAWAPFAGLPAGTEVAPLYGDFSKAEPYGMRVKFPAGYEVANHSHPTSESITVISGKLFMAFGKHANQGGSMPLVPGSNMILQAGAYHRLWAEADTVVEIHSTGPFGVTLAK